MAVASSFSKTYAHWKAGTLAIQIAAARRQIRIKERSACESKVHSLQAPRQDAARREREKDTYNFSMLLRASRDRRLTGKRFFFQTHEQSDEEHVNREGVQNRDRIGKAKMQQKETKKCIAARKIFERAGN